MVANLGEELDAEVVHWRQRALAKSTKENYQCHARIFLQFCREVGCTPLPVSTNDLCRYAAYLGRTRSFTTIRDYLNVVRVLHLDRGFSNPLADNFQLQTVMNGIRRTKGCVPKYKLPITTDHLWKICSQLNLRAVEDVQIWGALLVCFFGVLRISAVTVKSGTTWDPAKTLLRKDLTITPKGLSLQQSY